MFRFTRPLSFSSTADAWFAIPMVAWTRSGWVSASKPPTRTEPRAGRTRVDRMRRAVVLPARSGRAAP